MNSEYLVGRLETAVKQLQQAKSAFKNGQAPRGLMLMLDGLGNVEAVVDDWESCTKWKRVGDMELRAEGGELGVYRNDVHIGNITAQGFHEAADLSDEQLGKTWVETRGEGDE